MHDYQQASYAMASMAGMVRARNDLEAELHRRDTGMELQEDLASVQAQNTELRRELSELRRQQGRKASAAAALPPGRHQLRHLCGQPPYS